MALENPALNQTSFDRARTEVSAEGTMSRVGTYAVSFVLLVLLVVAAGVGWSQVDVEVVGDSQVAIAPDWYFLVFFLTFLVGLVGCFAFKAAPLIGPLYAIGQGLTLGVVSKYFELDYAGIVLQAVGATLAVFLLMLLLYATGVVKVTQKYMVVLLAAMLGLMLLYFLAWFISLFGPDARFWDDPDAVGIGFSVVIALIAAFNLPADFDFIERASAAGAPRFMQWYAAFGLMISIIWVYVRILRLLALTRRA